MLSMFILILRNVKQVRFLEMLSMFILIFRNVKQVKFLRNVKHVYLDF
jgi:hypothetical protein